MASPLHTATCGSRSCSIPPFVWQKYFADRLPEDNVVYWDFDAKITPETKLRQLRLRHRGRGRARNPRLLGLRASRGASRRHGAEDYGRPRKALRYDRRGRRARSAESRFLCSSSRRFAGRLRHLGRLFLPRGADAPGARRSGVWVLVRAVSPDRKPSGEFVRTALFMRRVRLLLRFALCAFAAAFRLKTVTVNRSVLSLPAVCFNLTNK